ncbi:hypothetical protein [Photobacterium nomapromontoriensis]|uniref:hypothetical protein n=1 Tax=Photobacterium nomapromontoriensis TaxID=2910237 RepID=UPI003D0B4D03
MYKIKVVFSLLLVLSFVNGCQITPKIDPYTQIKDQGIVIASFNSPIPVGLVLEREDGEVFNYSSTYSYKPTKNVWSWLPPGKYQINALLVQSILGFDTVPLNKEQFNPIIVEIGRVTDLNQLIPIDFGGGKYTLLSLPRQGSYEADVVQENPKLLLDEEPIEWSSSDRKVSVGDIKFSSSGMGFIVDTILTASKKSQQTQDKLTLDGSLDHFQVFELVKSLSPTTNAVVSDNFGNDLIGTFFGKVKVNNNGIWSVSDTGTTDAILALEVTELNAVYAGLETGKVLVSNDFEKGWNEVISLGGDELIFGIKEHKEKLYVGTWKPTLKDGKFTVLSNTQISPQISLYTIENNIAEKLFTINGKEMFPFGVKMSLIDDNDYLYIILPGDTLFRVSKGSKEYTKLETPEVFSGASISDEGSVITIWRNQGLFSSAYQSKDHGATWAELKGIPANPIFVLNELSGETVSWSIAMNFNSSNLDFDKLEENGKWTPITVSDTDCRGVIASQDSGQYYCVLSNGLLREFSDGNWKK